MAGIPRKLSFFLSLLLLIFPAAPDAETGIRDPAIKQIARQVWTNDFRRAIESSRKILETEPKNPAGPFMMGTIFQTLSEEYRTDRFEDSISRYLDRAILLAEQRLKGETDNPEWHFIAGASYGYRALYRAFHGGWWGAFRDGLKCSSHLQETLKQDSTYYDAYLGLGAYHYWKTIKARDFLWLPFISDQRQQGMDEIRIAAARGSLSGPNARESLLRIFLTEKRFEELVALADSLEKTNPGDPYCLLYFSQGLIALERYDDAESRLRQMGLTWKKSPYFDPLGFCEQEYYLAVVFHKRGNNDLAQNIVDKILSQRGMRKSNAYFAETLDKAAALASALK